MNKKENKVLLEIIEKIGLIEGRTECIPEIKKKLDRFDEKLSKIWEGVEANNSKIKINSAKIKILFWLFGTILAGIVSLLIKLLVTHF